MRLLVTINQTRSKPDHSKFSVLGLFRGFRDALLQQRDIVCEIINPSTCHWLHFAK